MDKVGDFLTIVRNASKAFKPNCLAQWSKLRRDIANVLKGAGFIDRFDEVENSKGQKFIKIHLKYVDEQSVITEIVRHSKPGCRLYYSSQSLPLVLGGLGIAIVTTSKGVMSDKQARAQKVGGELLCKIW